MFEASTSCSSPSLPRSPRWWPKPPGKRRWRRHQAATTHTRLRTPTRHRTQTRPPTHLPPPRRQPPAHLQPPPSSPGEIHFSFVSVTSPSCHTAQRDAKSVVCSPTADWLAPLTLPMGMRKHCKSTANRLGRDKNATQEHHMLLCPKAAVAAAKTQLSHF